MSNFCVFETMKKLNSVVSPAGREDAIAEILTELAKPYCDEIRRDVMGSVICHKKGAGKKVMFSAHMDSIGVIVTHIDDKGFLRCSNLGGLNAKSLINTPVRFANGTRGLICCPGDKKIDDLARMSDVYIDIGATSREQALEKVQIADVAVFDTNTFDAFGMIVSPYLDDRVACIVLLKAMELLKDVKSDNDLYFVFSVQEEVGLRGATTAAFGVEPYVGIAVDVTRTGDTLNATPKMECACGDGAAIKVIDSSLVCSPKVVDALKKCAKEGGIKSQIEVLEAGGTDAGAMQRAKSGAYAGGISIPTRYIHSPQEMCSVEDVENCAKLCAAFAAKKIEF